jgi:hypothetical protein
MIVLLLGWTWLTLSADYYVVLLKDNCALWFRCVFHLMGA